MKNLNQTEISTKSYQGKRAVDATHEIKIIILKIKNTREDIKNLQYEESKFKKDLSAEIDDAEVVLNDEGRILLTWFSNEINRFDTESFKRENPKLYEKYLRVTTQRTLFIK